MRFELTQQYRSTASAINAAYASSELYPTLVGLPKLGDIEPLSREVDGDTVKQRIRFRFTADLPAAVTAVVDPKKLTWIQETSHDLVSQVTTFKLLPDHYADRLTASGTFRVAGTGDHAERIITGELKVRALFVAGKVEQAIVSGLAEYLEAEAPAVDHWVESQNA